MGNTRASRQACISRYAAAVYRPLSRTEVSDASPGRGLSSEDDSIRVEFAYAIPKARVRVTEPDGLLDLEDGVFLFDEHWDEVYRKKMDVTMQWPVFATRG